MRGAILAAATIGAAVAVTELQSGLFVSVAKAGGVAGLVMILASLAIRLWTGAVVIDARLPGGAGLAFEQNDEEVEKLELEIERLRAATGVRLARIERELFRGEDNGTGGNMQ